MNCFPQDVYSYSNYGNMSTTQGICKNEVPVNADTGFLELYVTKNIARDVATDAVVTIYARQGDAFHIPFEKFVIVNNPTLIELPIAHRLGKLIKGPEYYFTTYNLTIESAGYYKVSTLNIRLFPKIKVTFFYNLNKIIQGEPYEEEIRNIPPHPRDELINQRFN